MAANEEAPVTGIDEQQHRRNTAGRLVEPAGPDDFGINVACWGDTWRLYVNGRLDATASAAMIDIAEVLAARGAPAVDLDLAGVTQIDAEGRRAAGYAQEILSAAGATCRIIPPTPGTGPVFVPASLQAEALLAAG